MIALCGDGVDDGNGALTLALAYGASSGGADF
jgi:hypothetical protein